MPRKRIAFRGKRDIPGQAMQAARSEPVDLELIPSPIRLDRDFFIALADELWRLKGRIDRCAPAADASQTIRGLRESHRRLTQVLEGIGLVTIDYSGQPYIEGTRLDVAYVLDGTQPDEPLIVEETLRPAIHWQGTLIRTAQVVLGQEEVIGHG